MLICKLFPCTSFNATALMMILPPASTHPSACQSDQVVRIMRSIDRSHTDKIHTYDRALAPSTSHQQLSSKPPASQSTQLNRSRPVLCVASIVCTAHNGAMLWQKYNMDGAESKAKTNGRLVRIWFCYQIGGLTHALHETFYKTCTFSCVCDDLTRSFARLYHNSLTWFLLVLWKFGRDIVIDAGRFLFVGLRGTTCWWPLVIMSDTFIHPLIALSYHLLIMITARS